ncbi:metallophosphoesterase [Niveispirillum sp. KHB5.9]|uniref:metallophosphoesterase n=1 Tax=Niveispirillum sp. KHB5.9 TaxID=3400269 RepID=UPI003A8AE0FE
MRRAPPAGPPPRSGPPAVPDGLRVYAVGDIHGESRLLERMLEAIRADAADHPPSATILVFLGDYIDRGPDSRGVLDILAGDPLPGCGVRHLAGNHEAALVDFLDGRAGGMDWLAFGGMETVASYGLAPPRSPTPALLARLRAELPDRMPPAHLDFLHGLDHSCAIGDYGFVHAGIRPGRAFTEQSPVDLLRIREPFLSDPRPHDRVIVHGHTITAAPEKLPNRIGIDTGAYATGILTALRLVGTEQGFLQVRR